MTISEFPIARGVEHFPTCWVLITGQNADQL